MEEMTGKEQPANIAVGFVGTGAITAAMVTGLSSSGGPRQRIRLSPRNAAVAGELSRRFDNVSVCASNQEVLDTSETVVLAVRPQVAVEVLSGLRFSSAHTVISVIAGFPVRSIAGLVAPAARIARAIPLPPVARRRGPTAVHPGGGAASVFFAPLGRVFEIEAEEQLNAFSTATSTMAAYFALAGSVQSWMARKGVAEAQAREYLAWMLAGLADFGLEAPQRSFPLLAGEHATPGGLNEQVLRDLTGRGVFQGLTEALDAVHRRASGQSACGDEEARPQ